MVKGSDASNMFDEEPAADEVEYSDDEEEVCLDPMADASFYSLRLISLEHAGGSKEGAQGAA